MNEEIKRKPRKFETAHQDLMTNALDKAYVWESKKETAVW